MGSGIRSPFDPDGEGAMSGGVQGRDISEEFVDVSQPPEEQREEMSPSLATASREEDLEDFPEEPPLEVPSRELEGAVVLKDALPAGAALPSKWNLAARAPWRDGR